MYVTPRCMKSGSSSHLLNIFSKVKSFMFDIHFIKLIYNFILNSEAMAVRDAVLSQSPEFKEARSRALSNAISVYDLLSVALVRWGQVALLHEVCFCCNLYFEFFWLLFDHCKLYSFL